MTMPLKDLLIGIDEDSNKDILKFWQRVDSLEKKDGEFSFFYLGDFVDGDDHIKQLVNWLLEGCRYNRIHCELLVADDHVFVKKNKIVGNYARETGARDE